MNDPNDSTIFNWIEDAAVAHFAEDIESGDDETADLRATRQQLAREAFSKAQEICSAAGDPETTCDALCRFAEITRAHGGWSAGPILMAIWAASEGTAWERRTEDDEHHVVQFVTAGPRGWDLFFFTHGGFDDAGCREALANFRDVDDGSNEDWFELLEELADGRDLTEQQGSARATLSSVAQAARPGTRLLLVEGETVLLETLDMLMLLALDVAGEVATRDELAGRSPALLETWARTPKLYLAARNERTKRLYVDYAIADYPLAERARALAGGGNIRTAEEMLSEPDLPALSEAMIAWETGDDSAYGESL